MMSAKLVCIGILLLGSCLLTSAQTLRGRRVRVMYGDYDCSCSYYCPSYAMRGGACYDSDHWGWNRYPMQYCCIPSYMDSDRPDMYNNYGS